LRGKPSSHRDRRSSAVRYRGHLRHHGKGFAGPRQAMPELLPEVVPAVEISGGSVARFGGAG